MPSTATSNNAGRALVRQKAVPVFNQAPRHEDVEVQLHALTSALGGGDWSVSRPEGRVPGIHWIRDWVGTRVGPKAVPGIEPWPTRP